MREPAKKNQPTTGEKKHLGDGVTRAREKPKEKEIKKCTRKAVDPEEKKVLKEEKIPYKSNPETRKVRRQNKDMLKAKGGYHIFR